MKTHYYTLRLFVGILAITFTFACQSLLDLDSLGSRPTKDAGKDTGTDGRRVDRGGAKDLVIGETSPPLDSSGLCVPDAPCSVPSPGICATGKTVCEEDKTHPGTCQQTIQPGQVGEACDGQDQDCDGVPDESDPEAHQSCGQRKYCNQNTCEYGCWSDEGCSAANTCVNHRCRCGGNQLQCGKGESCELADNGTCVCGNVRSTSGKACGSEVCQNDQCTLPPDAGPQDQGMPDEQVPDQRIPDQASPDHVVQDQTPPDHAPIDQLIQDQPTASN